MNFFIIALFHAFPIVGIGLITKSRSALNWAVAIMCVVAAASGNPSFVIGDLLAIVLAYVCIAPLTRKNDVQKNEYRTKTTEKKTITPESEKIKVSPYDTSSGIKLETVNEPAIRKTSQTRDEHANSNKLQPLLLNHNNKHDIPSTDEDKEFCVGDKVIHKTRPEVGVSIIREITHGKMCTVEFSKSKFSGIPLRAIGTTDQVSQEEDAGNIQKQKKQALIENERIYFKQKQEKSENQRKEKEDNKKIKEAEKLQIALEQKTNDIKANFSRHSIYCLWHMSHRENIPNILKHGVLNHNDARRFNRIDISDPGAQRWRERLDEHYGRKIHDYAPLYINPRNPMLYVRRHLQSQLCLVEVSLSALFDSECLISDGNAASRDTKFYKSVDRLDDLPWDVLSAAYWNNLPDGKRKRCAEVLVYPKIAPKHLGVIYCNSHETVNYLAKCGHDVVLSPNLFF